MARTDFGWPPEAVDILRRLASKRTAAQIAEDLSAAFEFDVTKGSVSGKCRRLGIQLCAPVDPNAARPFMPRPKGYNAAQSVESIRNDAKAIEAAKASVLARNEALNAPAGLKVDYTAHNGSCSWVYDERGSDGLKMLCGEPKAPGSNRAFCERHAFMAVAKDDKDRLARQIAKAKQETTA